MIRIPQMMTTTTSQSPNIRIGLGSGDNPERGMEGDPGRMRVEGIQCPVEALGNYDHVP